MILFSKSTAMFFVIVSVAFGMFDKVFAIVVDLPPAMWQQDIAITWPTRVQWNETEIYDFIWLINEYLWFTITVITFAAVLYAGFKLITSTWGSDEGIATLLNVLKWIWVWVFLSVFSYLLVRLIINLL